MKPVRIPLLVALLVGGVLAAPVSAAEPDTKAVPTICGGKAVTISGTSSKEVIKGTNGDDVIHGGGGSDRIKGGGGNDTICGGYGDDLIQGGPGVDFIYGGKGDDSLEGNGKGDLLSGGPGNDVLDPGPGVGGTVEGGRGHDYVWIVDNGDNDLFGGGGKDAVAFAGVPERMNVNLFTGHYDSWGPGAKIGSLIFEFEVVIGTDFADIIEGDMAQNWLYGGHGADDIKGRGGDDFLYGEPGTDTLDGGGGFDVVDGGLGYDTCYGEKLKHCP